MHLPIGRFGGLCTEEVVIGSPFYVQDTGWLLAPDDFFTDGRLRGRLDCFTTGALRKQCHGCRKPLTSLIVGSAVLRKSQLFSWLLLTAQESPSAGNTPRYRIISCTVVLPVFWPIVNVTGTGLVALIVTGAPAASKIQLSPPKEMSPITRFTPLTVPS